MSSSVPSKAIDPARKGLSKSTIAAAEWCGRKAVYLEQVRDKEGARVRAAMPERVHFGSAVDEATQSLMLWWHADGTFRMEEIVLAAQAGVDSVRGRLGTEGIEWAAFAEEVELASARFAEWMLNTGKIYLPREYGLWTQGENGESIKAKFPAAGEVVGTPDAVYAPLTPHAIIVDVKTGQRHKGASDLDGSEMRFYAALYAQAYGTKHGLPRLAYLSYSRPKVEWRLTMRESTLEDIVLGMLAAKVVAKSVKGAASAAAFNTQQCQSCQYAEPLPGYSIKGRPFTGCEVGQLVKKEAHNGQA